MCVVGRVIAAGYGMCVLGFGFCVVSRVVSIFCKYKHPTRNPKPGTRSCMWSDYRLWGVSSPSGLLQQSDRPAYPGNPGNQRGPQQQHPQIIHPPPFFDVRHGHVYDHHWDGSATVIHAVIRTVIRTVVLATFHVSAFGVKHTVVIGS